ncbi:hypothetical protein KQX54_020222 [Cotesia glomerata]|uniref:Uncharacterized protein n=1 Tax=Cotesia glomerata TaxID=32391 RepID=A0AAV7J8W6_COTGL|nr:hypothetical protein KQX54_020222 [Cotesia glomerata]
MSIMITTSTLILDPAPIHLGILFILDSGSRCRTTIQHSSRTIQGPRSWNKTHRDLASTSTTKMDLHTRPRTREIEFQSLELTRRNTTASVHQNVQSRSLTMKLRCFMYIQALCQSNIISSGQWRSTSGRNHSTDSVTRTHRGFPPTSTGFVTLCISLSYHRSTSDTMDIDETTRLSELYKQSTTINPASISTNPRLQSIFLILVSVILFGEIITGSPSVLINSGQHNSPNEASLTSEVSKRLQATCTVLDSNCGSTSTALLVSNDSLWKTINNLFNSAFHWNQHYLQLSHSTLYWRKSNYMMHLIVQQALRSSPTINNIYLRSLHDMSTLRGHSTAPLDHLSWARTSQGRLKGKLFSNASSSSGHTGSRAAFNMSRDLPETIFNDIWHGPSGIMLATIHCSSHQLHLLMTNSTSSLIIGKVIVYHPGKDDLTPVVITPTSTSTSLTRPIYKHALLPLTPGPDA